MASRETLERNRRLLKRDYNRIIEEINKLVKANPSLEVVEQLDTLRISISGNKDRLDEMYYKYVEILDLELPADSKLEEELLKDRDNQFLNIDRAISVCNVSKRKFEGQYKRDSLNASVAFEPNSSSSSARLPKISVPTFNGDFRKFLDFKALFENLVHTDDSIPPVRKMHYLKESLVGEAAATLSNLSVSEDGYKEAWSRVLTKYDNKRLIIHTHMNSLFNAKKLKTDSNLRLLVDCFDSAVRGFRICNLVPDNWSPILAYMLYTRLDPKTRTNFDNQTTDSASYISFKNLFKFCESRSHNIEARKFEEMPQTTVSAKPTPSAKATEPKRSFLTGKSSCIACKEQHLLIDCPVFKSKSPFERFQLVRGNKMCVNCFSRAHNTAACTSPKRCKVCTKVHHTLLHLPDGQKPYPVAPTANETTNLTSAGAVSTLQSDSKFTSNVSMPTSRKFILLPSAVVRFQCGQKTGSVRTLLDDCSQPTLISDAFVRKYKLPVRKNPDSDPVRGIGFDNLNTPYLCQITLASRINSFTIDIEAEVIPAAAIRYTVNTISWQECSSKFQEIKNYQLADPAFYDQSPTIDRIDILLGAEFSELCKLNETVLIDQLTMCNTQFGWTLVGKFPSPSPSQRTCFLSTRDSTFNINDQLTKFWELENVQSPNTPAIDADHCDRHFRSTTTRDRNNKFILRQLFKEPPSSLAPNYVCTAKMFVNAEKRRSKEESIEYSKFMSEYENLGHMTKVENSGKGYFIPHHAVFKPSSTTTRTRVVFNASFKTASNKSLNDILMIGPQLQPDLFSALIRFRSYAIAFTADISKMYRQVWIHPEDRVHQKILWRSTSEAPLSEYKLNTVTYGTASASYQATRCLLAVAEDIRENHPMAAESIGSHFYMDDLLTGADSIEEANDLRKIIHSSLSAAGFELRKYQSNSSKVLETIPSKFIESTPTHEFGDSWAISILGVFWEPLSDALRVRTIAPKQTPTMTKRYLLSQIAKIFDPLGVISPFTIRAKLFLQRVWREGIDWDDVVSEPLTEAARQYFTEMTNLSNFAIRRPYSPIKPATTQIIGFCDSSDKAYCAAVYLRQITEQQEISCHLICAKTRVAPIKAITIPRLELQGALLLAELTRRLSNILRISNDKTFLFCDSEVVLAWMAKPDNQWDVFVKTRVQKIAAIYPFEHWSYVRTKDNPADLGTRGIPAKTLINSNNWSSGPPFLTSSDFFRISDSNFSTVVELRSHENVSLQVSQPTDCSIVNRFSSYNRLIAVIGRVILWVRKWRLTRSHQVKSNSDISLSACLCSARTAVIRIFQSQAYTDELEALRQSKTISKGSSLRSLDPFIDSEGVLRVSGRIQNSNFSYAKKHPIVLPKGCHFFKIYVDYIHCSFCHANKEFVVQFILANFYPVGGLARLVKARLRKCHVCVRFQATVYSQIMGQLPSARVNISRPFTHTGVDFYGPFHCKCLAHRSTKFNKVYACIFICMVTRAVHIETTSDLSSTVFLMALHRFIARRGLPAEIYSDRGTNFVGAKNYLDLTDEEIQEFIGIRQIKWHFNPPRTPHRGGLWEAAVKAAKNHLKKVILDQALNFEEYVTIFSRIEATLNSRPLCYRRATNSSEEFVLTPNHFLIGQNVYTLPEPESPATKLPLLARYNFIRSIFAGFWKLWRADYLNMLQRREKWQTRRENIEVGHVVLLKLPTPPMEWPLARVEAVHPDSDGQIRTVTVNCRGHLRCTDIRSLIKLPTDDEL